jgi:hypothetical protein
LGEKNCFHILHWATESEKYIILTLFYNQNYVNLSNLKFHPLCHTKSSFFWKSPLCSNQLTTTIHSTAPVLSMRFCDWLVLWCLTRLSTIFQLYSKYHHIMLYTSQWAEFELATLMVIGTDCIVCCKFIYHPITTTTVPAFL